MTPPENSRDQVSDRAVWAVCAYLKASNGEARTCVKCPLGEYGELTRLCHMVARENIQTVLRAVSEHPVGLPDGWVSSRDRPEVT